MKKSSAQRAVDFSIYGLARVHNTEPLHLIVVEGKCLERGARLKVHQIDSAPA